MSNNNEEINEEINEEKKKEMLDAAWEEVVAFRRTQVPEWTDRQWKVESMSGRLIHIRQLPRPEDLRAWGVNSLKTLVDLVRREGWRHGSADPSGFAVFTNYTLSPHQETEYCSDCGAPSNFLILEGDATLWLHCGVCQVG